MNAPITRQDLIAKLRQSDEWDFIVIGGGATGLGCAVEAATRGYRTLLLEKYDFAKGTSSRSTKLVHGGVRYLAQGNIALVREALHERGLLRRNAPHLVNDLTFVVPGYTWWSQLFYGAGLKLYDLLSGSLSLGHSGFLSEQDTLLRLPTLKTDGLRGGVVYHDGQFDDARLAITLLQTLLDYNGVALNYLPVVGLLKQGERVRGVCARDAETREAFELKGKVVVNATGVFVDDVRRMDDPTASAMLSPSQGVHIVVDKRFLPNDSAMMIPKTEDGRVLFAVPWHGKVVIGTTDTPVEHTSYEPRPLEEEIDFILRTAAQYLTPAPSRQDALSVFVGQRPLVKVGGKGTRGQGDKGTRGHGDKGTRGEIFTQNSELSEKLQGGFPSGQTSVTQHSESTAALSREHVICISASGLLTITGGKWTTYRKMGEDVVNQAMQLVNLSPRPSITSSLHLHGWTQTPAAEPLNVYGADAASIRDLPGANTLLHPRLPYLEAEVRWAARYELARTVEDILARRTRSLLLDAIASIEASGRVAAILADELGLDTTWEQQQIADYQSLAAGYLLNYQGE
ncbi:MAG: glycerol-3-phosphate dehydrogenase/oxidase [Mojavia pulchra JT2-VF2]|uniref:Glycerol-3-phosphate dehydrogenase/oxidase n=1 Tax=Mojavia pulchra JT2-VF2 TaxID=287848 RepID=A0A951Q609_9NOST|nr:glycerol-3-phosphate dehydrogenase/oxidase [Mojavia pulchra JT2-VF2]